jgi:enamine deaminase RidA (YjgF/YER057c/UK114 family)
MERIRIGSGAPWEATVGYSRAVRVGQQVFVAGTTATDATGAVVGATAYEQARQALRNIESALERCGAQMADVVRTRMYVVNIEDWEEIGRAHGEVFGAIRPAATMVEVRRLIDPATMLVEIEADAIIAQAAGDAP